MRVLLFGGGGMLGTDLQATAPAGVVVDAPTSRDVDITRPDDVARALDAVRPEWVINAAAYTQVDLAEAEQEAAFRVNADAPRIVADACATRGLRMVHFSTDYVFPGNGSAPYREHDMTGPLNAYGRSKLAGERAVLNVLGEALVIRSSWLYGVCGRSFPRTMRERASRRQVTRVVNDQHGLPTSTRDLAAATWKLMARRAGGVFHVAASGRPATWYDIARRVFEREGATDLLAPCTTSEFASSAARPRWSVLDSTRAAQLVGALPDWEASLGQFLGQLARAD